MARSSKAFPRVKLSGSHLDIGRQYGEHFKDRIAEHLELALNNLQKRGVKADDALDRALRYRPFVQQHAAFLDEEIVGLAEGAALSLAQAYVLQLRAEVLKTPQELKDEPGDECTTYAIEPAASKHGESFLGQNADLPPFYADIGVVIDIDAPDHPNVIMVTPAGQISYIGMNEHGFAVGANYLTCDGWTLGVPRYLLSRMVLTCNTVTEAATLLNSLPRASSRNIIMIDPQGQALDVETIPSTTGQVHPKDGILAHSNHFLAPDLTRFERAKAEEFDNSQIRVATMRKLLTADRGNLTLDKLMAIMRNRDTVPDALCRHPGERPGQTSTIAAMIAQPSQRTLWVAIGPPDKHLFHGYTFGKDTVQVEKEEVSYA
ncbi:MAG: C45 family peptidase [Deinococcota bacterium]